MLTARTDIVSYDLVLIKPSGWNRLPTGSGPYAQTPIRPERPSGGKRMNIRRSKDRCGLVSAFIAVIVAIPALAFGDTAPSDADIPAHASSDAPAAAPVGALEEAVGTATKRTTSRQKPPAGSPG